MVPPILDVARAAVDVPPAIAPAVAALAATRFAGVVIVVACVAYALARLAVRARPSAMTARGSESPMGAILIADTLQRRGVASGDQLAGMTRREQEFLYRAVVSSAPRRPATPVPIDARAPSLRTVRAVPRSVHCPLCATPMGEQEQLELHVAPCRECGRRLSTRVEGRRLVITVDDAFAHTLPPR